MGSWISHPTFYEKFENIDKKDLDKLIKHLTYLVIIINVSEVLTEPENNESLTYIETFYNKYNEESDWVFLKQLKNPDPPLREKYTEKFYSKMMRGIFVRALDDLVFYYNYLDTKKSVHELVYNEITN